MTKIDVRNELRTLQRLCRAGKGKGSDLHKKYEKLFADALDDFEKLIMTEHFINGKKYFKIAIKINSTERTIARNVSYSLEKITEHIKKGCN